MITTSNSSLHEEEQDAQSISRCSTEHHRLFRAVLRAHRTCSTADHPTPGASSNTTEPPVCAPSRPSPSCVHAYLPLHPRIEKIVHWTSEILLAAEIAFCSLHRDMPEQ